MRKTYIAQVQLLVRILPFVAREMDFALKGGTAINLFYQDLPRLSVDIDLCYLPIRERAESLKAISAAMGRIGDRVERGVKGAVARRIAGGGGQETRILIRLSQAEVKIEVSPVLRGCLHPPERLEVVESVQNQYGFAEIQVVSFEDLYGGKLHAALDRQHPRDLFDVALLYENEGLTDALFHSSLAYLASSNRPLHELLDPRINDFERMYRQEFAGMTYRPVTLEYLKATRRRLIRDIRSRLEGDVSHFLLSLHDGSPDFSDIGLPQASELPAVRWKLRNIKRLMTDNPKKHAAQREALERVLAG